MEMKKNSELRGFVDHLNFQDPLNPREGLYRGRTNATRLFCTKGGMRYVDVCFLYPFVLKYKPFPCVILKSSRRTLRRFLIILD